MQQLKQYLKKSFHRRVASAFIVAPLFVTVAGTSFADDRTTTLSIDISGIKKDRGTIRVAVFDTKEAWLKKPVYTAVMPVNGNDLRFSQEAVPYGVYAVAVYHDVDSNGELNTNFIGLPKEPYGFSNNARGSFGPAKWKKASFTVDQANTSFNIKVK